VEVPVRGSTDDLVRQSRRPLAPQLLHLDPEPEEAVVAEDADQPHPA
jgi:hypothetical protein